jgi:hypothetical protein
VKRLVFLLLLAFPNVWAQTARPKLIDGVISYTSQDGQQKTIQIEKKCSDLWVSPDESVIAFIAIDRETASQNDQEPSIEKSTVYIARRDNHFMPIRLSEESVFIAGRQWQIFRNPRVATDRKTAFFEIPYTETTSRVVVATTSSKTYRVIGDASTYCVVWGGTHSGQVILQRREILNDPSTGVLYRCYLRSQSGAETRIGDDCSNFDQFIGRWFQPQSSCH